MSDGLRHRRTSYFVQVPRDTIRDQSLSWKARGLLTYILDLPDGWKVRNRELAKAGPDGEEAVLSGLRQLREQGYYRLERRRLLDGTFSMAPSVSEVRVPEWAEDHRLFEGKPVSLIEVEPGRFMVQRPDGSTRPDDFPTVDEDVDNPTEPDFTEPGFSGSGNPGPIEREGKGEKINTPSLRSGPSSLRSVESPGSHESGQGDTDTQPALIAAPAPPDGPGTRQDVESLCNHLAYRIEHNGSKRPTITAGWLKAARLILDADHRDLTEAHWLIDWCQEDTFWQSNILSMTKFRQKYDQLRLKARQQVANEPRRPVVYIDFGAEAANG